MPAACAAGLLIDDVSNKKKILVRLGWGLGLVQIGLFPLI